MKTSKLRRKHEEEKIRRRAEKIAELYLETRGRMLRIDYVEELRKKGLISDATS